MKYRARPWMIGMSPQSGENFRSRRSRTSIARILKHKGVDPQIVQEVLEPLALEDECEQARVLWMRRFGSLPENDRERARHVRFLVSRGYSVDLALRVLRLVKSGLDP